jgi:hypothetical protein
MAGCRASQPVGLDGIVFGFAIRDGFWNCDKKIMRKISYLHWYARWHARFISASCLRFAGLKSDR